MREPRRDPAVRAALHVTDASHEVRQNARAAELATRIKRSSAPALLRRRYRSAPASAYLAHWSAVLLPVGMACAVVAAVVLITMRPDTPPVAAPDAVLLHAATNQISTPEVVDLVLLPADAARAARPERGAER